MAETYGYRSISGSAPTLANLGNSFGKAGSRVVARSAKDRQEGINLGFIYGVVQAVRAIGGFL